MMPRVRVGRDQVFQPITLGNDKINSFTQLNFERPFLINGYGTNNKYGCWEEYWWKPLIGIDHFMTRLHRLMRQ